MNKLWCWMFAHRFAIFFHGSLLVNSEERRDYALMLCRKCGCRKEFSLRAEISEKEPE